MKLKVRREIVQAFKDGSSIGAICDNCGWAYVEDDVEQVLREYMNGEFTIPRWFRITLAPKPRRKR